MIAKDGWLGSDDFRAAADIEAESGLGQWWDKPDQDTTDDYLEGWNEGFEDGSSMVRTIAWGDGFVAGMLATLLVIGFVWFFTRVT